jgi:hypothetical protein
MNLLKVTMKCGRLIVFIRHDSAEIWGFVNDPSLSVKIPSHVALGASDMRSCGVEVGPAGIHTITSVMTAAIGVLIALWAQWWARRVSFTVG